MTATAWDPAHTGSMAVLSNGNRDVALTDDQNSTRLNIGYNLALGGTLYWEYLRTVNGDSNLAFPGAGIVFDGEAFSGNGSIAWTGGGGSPSGFAVYDNDLGTTVLFHNDSSTGIGGSIGQNIGGAVSAGAGEGIGMCLRAADGELDVYNITAGVRSLFYTITGIPLTGIIYPAVGIGGTGATTEAYRWNGGVDAFMDQPVGSVSYDSAVIAAPASNFFLVFR